MKTALKVYLDKEQHDRLRAIAQEQGVSMADLLRRAVEVVIDRHVKGLR